jgi:hypothetical protein
MNTKQSSLTERWRCTAQRCRVLMVCASLLLGIVGIIAVLYIQQDGIGVGNVRYTPQSDTQYGIFHCTEQSLGLPDVPDPYAPTIPNLSGCTGTRMGWPAAFVSSDVQISVGVNNPKVPVTIGELFGFSAIHINFVAFLVDWLIWSVVGFVIVLAAVWYTLRRMVSTKHG